jgi:hypothetical protein
MPTILFETFPDQGSNVFRLHHDSAMFNADKSAAEVARVGEPRPAHISLDFARPLA